MNLVNIKKAFILTIPVLLGYIFLGIGFGILIVKSGFDIFTAFISSTTIYAGSMQYALAGFLKENISLISIVAMTFFINSRHMFYGLSLLERYNQMGKLKPYMIFSLTDETYALMCSLKGKEDYESNSILFLISFFNQIYWIIGGVLGSLIGTLIQFDSRGIEFVMTALFVTIVIDQYRAYKDHVPFYLGLIVGILSLLIFKAANFILPALIIIVILLVIRMKRA